MTLARHLAIVLAGGALAFAAPEDAVRFAAPVRITAGDAFLGAGRMYPSPVLHDLNGDGRPDLVVGDLPGRVTVSLRTDDGFAAEQPVLDRDGAPLRFHNW